MKKTFLFLILIFISIPIFGDFNRGIALYNQKNYWDAKEEFRKTLAVKKGHLPANAMLASCLYRLKKYSTILSYFPELIKNRTINLNDLSLKKYSCLLLKQIGFACLQTGQSKKAIVALSIANKLINNDSTIYNSLGLAYLKIGKYRLAEISFQTAVNIYPSNYFFHNNLGAAYLEQGNFKMALQCFEKSVRINWNYENGWDNVWVSREKMGIKSNRGWKSFSYFSTASNKEKDEDRWKAEKERKRKERLKKEQQERERQNKEAARKQDEERRKKEAARKKDEERRKKEAARKQDEERRKKEAEKKRKQEEARRRAEQKKREAANNTKNTNTSKKPSPKPVEKPSPKPKEKPSSRPSSGTNS